MFIKRTAPNSFLCAERMKAATLSVMVREIGHTHTPSLSPFPGAMSLDNVEDSIKIIVVGDGNVGKTTLLRRFVKGEFTDNYKKTIGAEFMEKDVFLHELNQTVTLMLWDTAGQEVFNALTSAYYRGAGAAVLAFSTTDRDSFMNVEKWKANVEAQCGNITMILCQTKIDLKDSDAAFTDQEAEALAIKLQLPFFRCSTKRDWNVSQLFEFAATQCVKAGCGMDGGVEALHGNVAPKPAAAADSAKPAPKKADEKPPESEKPIDLKDAKKKKKEGKKESKMKCVML
jgi:Rab family protein